MRQGSGIPHKTVPAPPRPQEYRIKESISAFEKKLSADFFRIHRSYLVNLGHVGRIARKEVTMDTGESLPVARNRWEALNQAYLDY